MDRALLDRREEEKLKPSYFPLRPSASGYCGRRTANDYAAFLGQRSKVWEERKPSVIRLLSFGFSVETHSIRNFEHISSYRARYKQQSVMLFPLPVSGTWVEGSIDLFLEADELLGARGNGIADVKSVGSRWSSSFKSSWEQDVASIKAMSTVEPFEDGMGVWVDDVDAFLDEIGEHTIVSNITQVNLYCLSDWAKLHECVFGSIYRYSKNNSEHFEVRFRPSQKLYDKIKAKYEAIDRAVAGQKQPEIVKKDFALGSMACAYCPYQKDCWPGASKKDVFAGAPKKDWATRVSDLEGKAEVEQLFSAYTAALQVGQNAANIEQKLLVELEAHGVRKVKLEDNSVWEVKELKSPKPHLELRRSKE